MVSLDAGAESPLSFVCSVQQQRLGRQQSRSAYDSATHGAINGIEILLALSFFRKG
jgi:hypothetical protein